MRTKHCLAALCLPLAFAACSNEDFIEQTPSLEGRGTVDITINAVKPAFPGADTRMSMEGNNFVWEKDVDMIGAALVDGASASTVANDILVNYPFAAMSNGTTSAFNAKSSITKGLYSFYYGYQDIVDRKALVLNTAQTYKVGDTKTPIQQAANQMKMITPIINLAAGVTYKDAQAYNLDLSFANLYTMVKVTINSKNLPATGAKVQKVTLNSKAKAFTQIAKVDFTEIVKVGTVTLGDDKQLKATEMTAALTALEAKIAAGSVYVSGDKTDGPAILSINGDLALSATEATVLYILAPKGTYQDLVLTVETNEGIYTNKMTGNAGGYELANGIAAVKADLDFDTTTGNIVLPLIMDIAKVADWDNAVAFVNSHAASYIGKEITFNLTDNITVPSFPAFNITITGSKTLTLTKDYTITADNATRAKSASATLVVAKGATLTLNVDQYTANTKGFSIIQNNGTLVVKANQSAAIKNNGAMTVSADAELTGGLTNGAEKTDAVPAISGKITVDAAKNLTIGTAKLDNVLGTIQVNGTLTNGIASSTNKGIINIAKGGVLAGSAAITNTGNISNAGKLAVDVTNADGIVVAEAGGFGNGNSAAKTITKGTVIVKDITTFAATQADNDKKYTFGTAGNAPTVTTEVKSKAEFTAADVAATGVTNITLAAGDWELAQTAGDDATKIIAAPQNAAGGITLADGANLKVSFASDVDIAVSGASSITAETAEKVITGNLTVAEGANLTVGDFVTFNAAASANSQSATINGRLTVAPGAKMYFKTKVTVGEKGYIVVMGSTNSDIENAAVFGSETDKIDNNGVVESKAAVAPGTEVGKVTLPKNGATGIFIGNSTVITFS